MNNNSLSYELPFYLYFKTGIHIFIQFNLWVIYKFYQILKTTVINYCFSIMKEMIKNRYLTIAFTLAGALGGFLYWKFVGCISGTCPIQSVWYWSTLWGAAIGLFAGDFINDIVLKHKKKEQEGK